MLWNSFFPNYGSVSRKISNFAFYFLRKNIQLYTYQHIKGKEDERNHSTIIG